jgi:hypothetical protein
MMYCLDELLKPEGSGEDGDEAAVSAAEGLPKEENLECFANLMTTMGEKLDDHARQKKTPFDWSKVITLATDMTNTQIANRIKFILQDLLELKDRGTFVHPSFLKASIRQP